MDWFGAELAADRMREAVNGTSAFVTPATERTKR